MLLKGKKWNWITAFGEKKHFGNSTSIWDIGWCHFCMILVLSNCFQRRLLVIMLPNLKNKTKQNLNQEILITIRKLQVKINKVLNLWTTIKSNNRESGCFPEIFLSSFCSLSARAFHRFYMKHKRTLMKRTRHIWLLCALDSFSVRPHTLFTFYTWPTSTEDHLSGPTKLMIELSATVEVMFTVLTTLFKKYDTPILSIYWWKFILILDPWAIFFKQILQEWDLADEVVEH